MKDLIKDMEDMASGLRSMKRKQDQRIKTSEDPELLIQTYADFGKTERSSISFDQIVSVCDGQWHPIAVGVDVIGHLHLPIYYQLLCHMAPGAELDIHDHPDIYEGFYPFDGYIIDKVSGRQIDKEHPWTFAPDKAHYPYAPEGCKLWIAGLKYWE